MSTLNSTFALWLAFFVLVTYAPESRAETYQAEYLGRVVVEWLDGDGPDRNMRLLEDFGYRDSSRKLWMVPQGTVIDGASIPSLFWTVVGPPFVGDYRKASVVHDYFCSTRSEPWQAVHRMFYEASLTGGVSANRALLMYAAVYGSGPRWKTITIKGVLADTTTIIDITPKITERELRDIMSWAQKNDPSADEVARKIDALTVE